MNPTIVAPTIAIVNYDMGNLFSVKQACEHVGLRAVMTSSKQDIAAADAVILPGVGAFGDAMETLRRYDLVETLQQVAASSKPFIGICLGMQLMMEYSKEFGHHEGLGIFKGTVVPFDTPIDANGKRLKVPQVGWNRIYGDSEGWNTSPLRHVMNGEFMYFVHSFHVLPDHAAPVLSYTRYGTAEFCSSLHNKQIFACQFHPERSGPTGLQIYKNLWTFF